MKTIATILCVFAAWSVMAGLTAMAQENTGGDSGWTYFERAGAALLGGGDKAPENTAVSVSRCGAVEIPVRIGELPVGGISRRAFAGCAGISELSIPEGIGEIGGWAFAWCEALTALTIPEGVARIEGWTFYGCDRMVSVSLPASVSRVAEHAFDGCAEMQLINVDPDNVAYSSHDGMLYDKAGKTLLRCPEGKEFGVIARGTEEIGWAAFANCRRLKWMELPGGITNIGSWAFAWCDGLETLKVPAGVKGVGVKAFTGCGGLVRIEFAGLPPEGLVAAMGDCKAALRFDPVHSNEWAEVVATAGFADIAALEASDSGGGYAGEPVEDLTDTFEAYEAGADVNSLAGWSGEDGEVREVGYVPPMPPGYVIAEATHERVLNVDERVARDVSVSSAVANRTEMMVCVRRSQIDLEDGEPKDQLRIAFDREGRVCLWHLYSEGGLWRKGWTVLPARAYDSGEWVRIGIEMDYDSNLDGDALARVSVDGSVMPTARGIRSPTNEVPYGAWHYLAKNRRIGGKSRLRRIEFAGTTVDDLRVMAPSVTPDVAGETSIGGIAFEWFDRYGLPRDPAAPSPFVPGYALADVYAAGIDPYSERPLEVTDFSVDAEGRVRLRFNGFKGVDPGKGYRLIWSATPDFGEVRELGGEAGSFGGDAGTWSTEWAGTPPAGFYRIQAVR